MLHVGTGVHFVLHGDSCIPGINCVDLETVFEEHMVLKRFDVSQLDQFTYTRWRARQMRDGLCGSGG